MASPSDLTASALDQGKQLLSTCLQSAFRARSGRRFIVIGAVLILAIAAADWLIVSMEREASFAAYETAGSNLSKGMNAQTSRMLGAVDKVLRDIPAALALGDIATPDLIKAAMRAGASSDLLADRQKRLQGVELSHSRRCGRPGCEQLARRAAGGNGCFGKRVLSSPQRQCGRRPVRERARERRRKRRMEQSPRSAHDGFARQFRWRGLGAALARRIWRISTASRCRRIESSPL